MFYCLSVVCWRKGTGGAAIAWNRGEVVSAGQDKKLETEIGRKERHGGLL